MFTVSKNNSWSSFFEAEKSKPYFLELMNKVDQEYQEHTCYPPKELIFKAFDICELTNLKIVIIGQDPYHGEGEANGLCFSVNNNVKIPPSLRNIFTEINSEYDRVLKPISGNLESWAKQGVLLLNASLSVRKDLANSHKHLQWSIFTDAVIDYINIRCDNIVFLLWGSFAHKKGSKINKEKHLVLKSGHPSPLSANRGFWFGNNHFILTNEYLKLNNVAEIEW